MSLHTPYIPRSDSLASSCIGFFKNNPDEHLTLEDIAEKFDCVRGNIHSMLRPAMDAGLLKRDRDIDGDYTYSAGSAILQHQQAKAEPAPAALQAARKTAPRGFKSPRHIIDADTLKVEHNVPYAPKQKVGVCKWEPVFLKLNQAGQSAIVPDPIKGALAAAALSRNKLKQGTYKVGIDAVGKTRIWRTA
ncbi:hypothetical protein SAMN05216344_10696 [Polaromonas sp. OV174]|uniref:hypothetical protein n=1 Tax=Polaromonas sp. OV174 TaxID=1855300 RepID=UPI0008E1C7CE|nr:hypothetical protein [Polaromonas sp. OV174]SFB96038.1 hypothetical protein SAMN05216344_10696 [Polaromonas sp. OV174]